MAKKPRPADLTPEQMAAIRAGKGPDGFSRNGLSNKGYTLEPWLDPALRSSARDENGQPFDYSERDANAGYEFKDRAKNHADVYDKNGKYISSGEIDDPGFWKKAAIAAAAVFGGAFLAAPAVAGAAGTGAGVGGAAAGGAAGGGTGGGMFGGLASLDTAAAAAAAGGGGGGGLGGLSALSAAEFGGAESIFGPLAGNLGGAEALGTTGLNAMRAAEIAGYATDGTLANAAVDVGANALFAEAGTTGLNAMRQGEIANYATDGTLPSPAVPTGTGAPIGTPPSGTPPTGTPPTGSQPGPGIKDGWDILNTAAGSPLGRIVTGLAGTALAGGAANALAPKTDSSRINQLMDGMILDQGTARDRSTNQWDDYIKTWRPVEQRMASSALNYDTPERRTTEANKASSEVASQYDAQRTEAERQAIQAGVDPSTMATMGLNSRIIQAKDMADAANNARTGVESRGLAYLDNAARFGRNLPSTSLQASQVGTNQANSAVNAQNSTNAAQRDATNSRNAIFGSIIGAGANRWGMGDAKTAANTNTGSGTNLWNDVGNWFTSSEKTKHVGGKVDGRAASDAVEKSRSKHWRYKPGLGDGNVKQRMGPMAEALHRVAPDVSDGKRIDNIAMMGLHHAAIGGQATRLAAIEKKLGLSSARSR